MLLDVKEKSSLLRIYSERGLVFKLFMNKRDIYIVNNKSRVISEIKYLKKIFICNYLA